MMARSKQADDTKVNRGDKKPSLDDVVEGTAFEKETVDPAGQTGGQNGPARPSTTTRVSGVTLVSLIMSLVAMAGVAFLYYKINADTEQAMSARDKALTEFNDVLGDRLDAVEARLSPLEVTASALQQEADEFEVKIDETARATADDFAAIQSAMAVRLGDVETQLAEFLAAEAPVLDVDAQDNTAAAEEPAGNSLADQTMPDQIAVLVVMGLLSDAAAGRPLARWTPALSSYAESDNVPASVEQAVIAAITAINASPPPADSLLADGVTLAASMAIGVNEVGVDASLFERARASLGQVLRLRSTNIAGDDPHSQLARFDLALSRRDLTAAAGIAGMWNGPKVDGLEGWHQNALSRFALDKALADLTAAIVGMVG